MIAQKLREIHSLVAGGGWQGGNAQLFAAGRTMVGARLRLALLPKRARQSHAPTLNTPRSGRSPAPTYSCINLSTFAQAIGRFPPLHGYLSPLRTLYSVLRTLYSVILPSTFPLLHRPSADLHFCIRCPQSPPLPSRAPLAPRLLPIQTVREMIQVLAAVLRDDDHVFNANAAEVLTIQARLNGQGFAG